MCMVIVDDDVEVPCRLLSNGTVECKRYVYTGVDEWKVQRDKIDRILHTYRHRIAQLKVCSGVCLLTTLDQPRQNYIGLHRT